MPVETPNRETTPSKLEQMRRKEGELWRVSLLLLTLLATALAVSSWESLRALPAAGADFNAVPVGVVVLFLLFAAYVWQKKREIAELQGFVRGLQERATAPPTIEQVEQLADVLVRSQRGYRELIDSFDDLVFALSLDGKIRAANRRFAEVADAPFSEVIGRKLEEFLDQPPPAVAEKALAQFLERRHWSGVVRAQLRKTSAVRYFDCMLHAILQNGQVVGVGGLARDVTQQRESEGRFTELFESLKEGIYVTTPEGALLEVNPALVEMLGYTSKEELLGLNFNDLFFHPGGRRALLREFEEDASLREREITLRHKDGRPITCVDTSTAFRDATGRVIRFQGTLVDLTQRLEIEKRLHEEREFARRLVDSLPDLIVVLDTRGRYTFVSSRITEMLGYRMDELLGRALGERTHPEDQAAMLGLYREVLGGQRTLGTVEYRTQHKDGTSRVLRATASPLYDADDRISGVIASARDVTELKRLEHQLIQSEKLAAMGQMIAGVAHELNNPLTAILGVSDLLRDRAWDDAARRHLEMVHQQARRAAEIVQNLLLFSRPPAPSRSRLKLSELVRRTLQLHDYFLRSSHITVDLQENPGLPEVVGDSNQLMQVFLNLISNAEQAIREARDHGTLRVRFGRADENVWVAFEDDGPGIPPDVLPRIFDPFFTTKRPGRGTGLGLSICLAIVREHGGHIDVQPAGESGTRFTVWLPVGTTPQISPEQTASRDSGHSLRGQSILVVDDEETIRDLLSTGLSARGATVDCVATGEEALARAAEHPYDAILCDLRMPGLNGNQLFGQLQARTRNSKQQFIFMTGDPPDRDALDALRQKGAHVVQKPFRMADLTVLLAGGSEVAQPKAR